MRSFVTECFPSNITGCDCENDNLELINFHQHVTKTDPHPKTDEMAVACCSWEVEIHPSAFQPPMENSHAE